MRGAHFVFDWYFTKFRGAQKMSGEMLVISFVCEVNHVIMAATLDRRQNQQIPHKNFAIVANYLPIHACYCIGYTFSVGNHHMATIQCH